MAGARLRLLATEISETSRVTRGRLAADDGAVVDLTVDDGEVIAVVVGAAGRPQTVRVVNAGIGLESPWSVDTDCDCADTGEAACEHIVATLLTFADEVAADSSLLDRWSATARPGDLSSAPPTSDGAHEIVVDLDDDIDPLAGATAALGTIPNIPVLSTIEHPPIADAVLRSVLADALVALAATD